LDAPAGRFGRRDKRANMTLFGMNRRRLTIMASEVSTPALSAAGLVPALSLALAMLLAGGCGQGGSGKAGQRTGQGDKAGSGTQPAQVDACELLPPADVQAVSRDVAGSLSSTLDDAVGHDPTQCSYGLAGGSPPKVLSLVIRQSATPEQAARLHQAAEAGLGSLAGSRVEPVAGLGDGAFWVGGRLQQLHVRKGATRLIFTVQLDKDALPAAKTLAAKALARLAAARPSP
jgi:hypothetical protein